MNPKVLLLPVLAALLLVAAVASTLASASSPPQRRAIPKTTSASKKPVRYWQQQARLVTRLAAHPPHKRGWLCIHRFEGSWRDAGDPYWGGLQMDRGFISTYAPRVLLRE